MRWKFWNRPEETKPETTRSTAEPMPDTRDDGFLFMDLPEPGAGGQPDYLDDTPQISNVPKLSPYVRVDHDALAKTNAERERPRSLWEKLRNGQPLTVDDLPMQGFLSGLVLRVLNWALEPFVLFFSNLGTIAVVAMTIVMLMLVTFFLGEWSQWMFRDLY